MIGLSVVFFMNRLEDELESLNFTISTLKNALESKKNIRHDDWCKAHQCICELKIMRDKLLDEKKVLK